MDMGRILLASEALTAGEITRQQLRTRHVMLYRDVYAPSDLALTAWDWAYGAWLWSGRKATLVGNSAAVVHGTKFIKVDERVYEKLRATHEPAEIARSRETRAAGIVVRSGFIADDEIVTRYGIPCTSPARTGYDVGRFMRADASILRLDALMNATGCGVADIEKIADRYPKARGIRSLRSALGLADGGAESPQESRLRLILLRGGLGPIEAQIPVTDGRVLRRIDMGWPEWKVGVEYDGEQHFTSAVGYEDDIDRLEFLAAMGWLIVRVSSRHMRDPSAIVERARRALVSRGWVPRPHLMT